jgi:dTDP-4-dehydrorhamnose reductase
VKAGRVLILGGIGMLGHVLVRHLSGTDRYDVYATCRDRDEVSRFFPPRLAGRFIEEKVEAEDFDSITRSLDLVRPDAVINCIGIIKQRPEAEDPLTAITINSLLPHRVSLACRERGIRMVHVSTDCVFDGKKGMYTEEDLPAPEDLYGRTKLLGEVNGSHCVTLRTSIIGHELRGRFGLIEWFLGESGRVRGYTGAIYSGFPTIEFARIIADRVLPDTGLAGLYHVSSEPVSKFDLLHLVARRYHRETEIEPISEPAVDRSLLSDRFRSRTGYMPPSWPDLIDAMCTDYEANREQYGR